MIFSPYKVSKQYYIKELSEDRFEILSISHDMPCYRIIKLSNNTYIAYHLIYNNAMLGNFNDVESAYEYCTGETYNMSSDW